MDHEQVLGLLDRFVDGELDAGEVQRISDHLNGCASCSTALEHTREVGVLLRRDATHFALPDALRERLARVPEAVRPARVPVVRPWGLRWGGFAALACSSLLFALTAAVYFRGMSPTAQADDEVVSAHVRAMITGDAIAVASSDQHTVKPWYVGKLDFSPPVHDFASDGFTLLGGRLDYIDHRPVAVVVYRHLAHVISVYVEPSYGSDEGASPVALQSLRGYQIARWSQGTLRFWAVSDVEAVQLNRLAQDIIASSRDPLAIDR